MIHQFIELPSFRRPAPYFWSIPSLCSILYTEVKKSRKASGQLGGEILPTPTFSFFPHQTIHVAPFSASKHGVRKDRVFAQLCAISSMAKATVSLNYDEHHSAHRLPRWQKKKATLPTVSAGWSPRVNQFVPPHHHPIPGAARVFSPFIFSRATKQPTEKEKKRSESNANDAIVNTKHNMIKCAYIKWLLQCIPPTEWLGMNSAVHYMQAVLFLVNFFDLPRCPGWIKSCATDESNNSLGIDTYRCPRQSFYAVPLSAVYSSVRSRG